MAETLNDDNNCIYCGDLLVQNRSEKYLFGWVIKSIFETEERMTGHRNATDLCSTSSSSVFLFFVQNFVNKIMSAAHSKGLGFCMHA
jgi:hypothetical protein